MSRRFKIDRTVQFNVRIPSSIYEKVQQQLWSEIEDKVPFGVQSNLITELLTEWLRERGVIV
jgi:hypothetical protein